MIRDIIVDKVKIGEIELPDDTGEEEWTAQLALYSVVPTRALPNVSPRQIRRALLAKSGLTEDNIDSVLRTLPEPTRSLAFIDWKNSVQFERNNEFTLMVAKRLNYSAKDLDDLWELASSY
jgi:hypothetical protein